MSRGGSRSKAGLTYDREAYYLDALKGGSLTNEQMVAEYNRLRVIAVKRLERFEKSKEWSNAEIYRQYAGSFEQPASSLNQNQLMRELADVSQFITSKRSSIRGLQQERAETIQTLHERGYTGITTKNFKDFTHFMDEIQTLYQSRKFPPSEELVELYMNASKKGLTSDDLLENLDDWLDNKDELKKLTMKEVQKAGSSSAILHALVMKKERKIKEPKKKKNLLQKAVSKGTRKVLGSSKTVRAYRQVKSATNVKGKLKSSIKKSVKR